VLPRSIKWDDVNASQECWATDAASFPNGTTAFFLSVGPKQIGVVTGPTPDGPFSDPLGKPLIPIGLVPTYSRDPTVLMDDDGQSYLMFGTFNYFVAKLNPDLISLAEKPRGVKIMREQHRDDKPFLHKHNGRYYLSWGCWYAIGDSPYGPFNYSGGVINVTALANTTFASGGGTKDRHGSFFTFHGQTYFACNDESHGGGGGFRSTIIAYVHYRANGTIAPIRIDETGVGNYNISSALTGPAGGASACPVSRAFPSWNRSILTEIYLCHAPVLVTKLRTGAPGQACPVWTIEAEDYYAISAAPAAAAAAKRQRDPAGPDPDAFVVSVGAGSWLSFPRMSSASRRLQLTVLYSNGGERAVAYFCAAVLAEIYLCASCSCHEILRSATARVRGRGRRDGHQPAGPPPPERRPLQAGADGQLEHIQEHLVLRARPVLRGQRDRDDAGPHLQLHRRKFGGGRGPGPSGQRRRRAGEGGCLQLGDHPQLALCAWL
jgi:hypothetical protein